MIANTLSRKLHLLGVNNEKLRLLSKFIALLPEGVNFESDQWDVLKWHTRKGNRLTYLLSFENIYNTELKLAVKLYVLERRFAASLSASTLMAYVKSISVLDGVIGKGKKLKNFRNVDFFEAEDNMAARYKGAYRSAGYIEVFGRWLNQNYGLRISYKNRLHKQHRHGRKSSEENRLNKRINLEIIRQLIESNNRRNINKKDKFFLSAFTINVGCGFRINELATLPKNPIVNDGDSCMVRFYAEKGGRLDVRPVASAIAPAIISAIKFIQDITEPGRKVALTLRHELKKNSIPDWHTVLRDSDAAVYFTEKFCHEWTSKPMHDLFNKCGGWYEKKKIYVDVLSLVKECGSHSAASRAVKIDRNTLYQIKHWQEAAQRDQLPDACYGKINTKRGNQRQKKSWDTDSRVISILQFEKYANKKVCVGGRRELVREVIDNARNLQMQGKIYPKPKYNKLFEFQYRRRINAVVETKEHKHLLEPEDALFVIREKELARNIQPSDKNYKLVDDSMFTRWLNGSKRAQGTGNHEDSVFSRLGILDPDTGESVKFTWHDIRHWLHTTYAEGGLSEEQLGLVFSRNPLSNHTYDQTSAVTRLESLRCAIRENKSYGVMQDNYNRISEYNREEAENYLEAKTIMVRAMPHGGCTHNFAATPCPHHNSCFVREDEGDDDLCEHLYFDFKNTEQMVEIKRLLNENEIALKVLPSEGRQYLFALKVKHNLESLLDSVSIG